MLENKPSPMASRSSTSRRAIPINVANAPPFSETIPLLRAPKVPGERSSVYDPSMVTDFSRLGWRMHVLPDTSVYFSHPNLRVITDVDLRRVGTMRQISEYLGAAIVPPHGWELWLRQFGKGDGNHTEHFWIHHDKRIIVKPTANTAEETMMTDDESKLFILCSCPLANIPPQGSA
jgi:hypothetical protein